MLIEYRYEGQKDFKSYTKCEDLKEIIVWLKQFFTYTLEDHTEQDKIKEIRITLNDTGCETWIQMYKKESGKWEIAIVINDYVLGSLIDFETTIVFIEKFLNKD